MANNAPVIIVCGIYFLLMIAAGIFAVYRNKKASDFLVAGRKVNLLMTTATLAAVQIGAGIVLGGASNGASMGLWPGMWYSIGCGGGLILAGFFVAAKLRTKDGYVPLDFFEVKYGANKWIRLWAWLSNVPSLLGIFIAQMLACGSILSGFGIPFGTGVVICAAVVMVYSTIGGMWGVIITDAIQTGIIMIGIPIAAIGALSLLAANGIAPMSVFATPFMPAGTFTKFIYLVVPFLFAISVSYDAYMRYQSSKDARTAKWGCIIAGILVMVIGTLASSVGAAAHLLFPEVKSGVFSFMTIKALHPVLAGIVISAVLAAAMSSASCLLVSMGGTFSRDLYNKVFHPGSQLDDLPHAKAISRAVVAVSAVAGVLLSFKITNILDAIILFNYPYMGSLLIPLLVGVLWQGATTKGAIAAVFVGGLIGIGAFLCGIPGPLSGWVNPDLGLFFAYGASLVTIVAVSLADRRSAAAPAGAV